MKRLFTFLFVIFISASALAQTEPDAKTKKILDQAAKNGNAIKTEINVKGNIHAQAVLIPRVDAKRIFGKEIGEHYAVIEVNIGNKSPDAALIIQGIFIDYRNWPLSGVPPSDIAVTANPDDFQSPSVPNQVASEEYRVVRGQLLDAQMDTWRNRFLRWLTLGGNLAAAFSFSINEQGIVRGIAAATGVGIPGVATAWPDRTVEQLNRVSDFGFRSPKLVPKQGSEVIICFFPIDRFLTPGFRKLFLKSPALFFAPLQMLFDESIQSDVDDAVGPLLKGFNITLADLRSSLPCYMKVRHPDPSLIGYDVCLESLGLERWKNPKTGEEQLRVAVEKDNEGKDLKTSDKFVVKDETLKKFKTFLALEFIGGVSLNRVTVTIDGVMTVDVTSTAARIDEVSMDSVADCGDADNECIWTDISADGGDRTGVIRGAYITSDSDVRIAEAAGLHIDELKKISEASNDNELHFSFKLTAPIPNQTKLHFVVTKSAPSADAKPLESNSFEYVVAYSPRATVISSVKLDNVVSPTKITVNGNGFDSKMEITLHSEAGQDVKVTPSAGTLTTKSFDVTLPSGSNALKSGCWDVRVVANGLSSNRSGKFAIPPSPTLVSAERNDKFIQVTGTDLVDLGKCGGQQVSFQLVGAKTLPLEVVNWNNGKPVLALPEDAKQGSWKVQVLLNHTAVSSNSQVDLKTIGQ